MGCSLSGLCTKQAPLYNQTEKSFHRIVLMGTGDSGKTTFLKQMRNTYQHGYPASERLKSKPCVFQNIITAVQIILEWSGRLKSKYSIDGCLTDCCNESVKKALLELSQTASLNEDKAKMINTFWRKDSGFMKTFELRSLYQLPCSTEYFLDKIEEVVRDDYVPSKEDVFRCRTETTGIIELDIEFESDIFKIIDVGGQRNQRKKWVHVVSGATAAIFLVAIDEYDLTLVEDGGTNRLMEALNLFEGIINVEWAKGLTIFLFLNKKDLFVKKFPKTSLTKLFNGFKGGDCTKAIEFIKQQFLDRVELSEVRKQIFTFETTATDSENINAVFHIVKNKIIKEHLIKSD